MRDPVENLSRLQSRINDLRLENRMLKDLPDDAGIPYERETARIFAAKEDEEIVWYGNMNFLGKDKTEDSMMRVRSKDIAAELMEITF